MTDGTIAIVGRPNVGKSSLFNRFIEERLSIVHHEAGITRDRLYAETTWLGKRLRFIDTGGLQIDGQDFQKEIQMQVEFAIDESDVVLFVVSAHEGLTRDDSYIASLLRKSNKKVLVLVNKVDNQNYKNSIYEFYGLSFGDPIGISASHGIGVGDALDRLVHLLPEKNLTKSKSGIRFAVIGRPNVGKSSLVNTILNEERVIVSDIEGTTRDAIDTEFSKDGNNYIIIDTAGIRKKGRIYEDVEKYSVLRALNAVEKADVVLLVMDAKTGLIAQDKNVAGIAHEAGKPIILVYNKWDQVDQDKMSADDLKVYLRNQLQYLSYAPLIFTSALTKRRVNQILPLVDKVYENSVRRIQTSVLNEVIHDAVLRTPPPSHKGRALRVLYASQVSVQPPSFVVFVNDPELCHFSYKRYLENSIRDAFDFEGTTIRIILRKRGN